MPLPLVMSTTVPLPQEAYAAKVYFVPAVFNVNASGISLLKATVALNPVQWVPTIWSGFIALISATVF